MTNNKYFSPALLITLLFFGCGPKGAKENDSPSRELPAEERVEKALHDEIMAVHDEVMPKIDVVMNIKGQLHEKLDSLRDLSEVPVNTVEKLESQIAALNGADESMMNWMHKWSPPGDSSSHEQKLDFYKEQKEAMEKVKDQMFNAISEGELLLKSLQ